MTPTLGVLPFLPPGRGALILMLGGLLMLPLSLLMSRMGARPPRAEPAMAFVPLPRPERATPPTPPARPPAQAAPQAVWKEAPGWPKAEPAQATWQAAPAPAPAWQEAPAPRPPPLPRPWAGTGIERAIRQAVGWTQLVGAEPGRYAVRVGRCASCIGRSQGCERERAAIAAAVAPYLQDAQVTERTCAQRGRGASCIFDVRGR